MKEKGNKNEKISEKETRQTKDKFKKKKEFRETDGYYAIKHQKK